MLRMTYGETKENASWKGEKDADNLLRSVQPISVVASVLPVAAAQPARYQEVRFTCQDPGRRPTQRGCP